MARGTGGRGGKGREFWRRSKAGRRGFLLYKCVKCVWSNEGIRPPKNMNDNNNPTGGHMGKYSWTCQRGAQSSSQNYTKRIAQSGGWAAVVNTSAFVASFSGSMELVHMSNWLRAVLKPGVYSIGWKLLLSDNWSSELIWFNHHICL